jgi:uncharacterized protein
VSPIVTRLRVDRISEEITHHRLRPDAAWIQSLELGAQGEFGHPLVMDLEIARSGEEVFVSGEISGRLLLACSRCLEPAEKGFQASFRVVYLPAPETAGAPEGSGRAEQRSGLARETGSSMVDSKDEDVLYHVNGWLDLNPMLREQIALCIPDRALCREDCRGLCPSCGADLNTAACGCTEGEGFSKFDKLKALRFR